MKIMSKHLFICLKREREGAASTKRIWEYSQMD